MSTRKLKNISMTPGRVFIWNKIVQVNHLHLHPNWPLAWITKKKKVWNFWLCDPSSPLQYIDTEILLWQGVNDPKIGLFRKFSLKLFRPNVNFGAKQKSAMQNFLLEGNSFKPLMICILRLPYMKFFKSCSALTNRTPHQIIRAMMQKVIIGNGPTTLWNFPFIIYDVKLLPD